MSRFSKAFSGEMYKIFHHPITYIFTALLVVALVVSCCTFSSQNEYVTQYTLGGSTKSEIDSSFISQTSMNKSIADTQLTNAKTQLENVKSRSKTTESLKEKIQDAITAFSSYQTELQKANPEINYLRNYRETMDDKLKQTEEELEASVVETNLTILVSDENYKRFMDTANKALAIIATSKDKNLVATHQEIANKLEETNILQTVKNYLQVDFSDIVISEGSYTTLSNLYQKAQQQQETILNDSIAQKTNDKVSVETYRNTLLGYFYVSQHYATLVENTILYDNVLNFNDSTVRKYKGYKEFTVYKLRENITRATYLLKNSKNELSFTTMFKSGSFNSEEASTPDLIYYGLNICSIVLLIFAVILITRQIAGEHSDGSLKVLLTYPFKRHKILSAKILSTLLTCLIMLVFAGLILFIVGAISYGFDSTTMLAIFNSQSAFKISSIALLTIYFGLIVVKLLFFILVSVLIAVLIKNKWISGAISLGLLALTLTAPLYLTNSILFAYTPFAGIDLFKFFGNAYIAGNSNAFIDVLNAPMYLNSNFYISIATVSITIIACIIISYSLFRSRKFN